LQFAREKHALSGLLALLDDVVALTKATAATLDDVAGQAARAGAKAAGVVIDDAHHSNRTPHLSLGPRALPTSARLVSSRHGLFFYFLSIWPHHNRVVIFWRRWMCQALADHIHGEVRTQSCVPGCFQLSQMAASNWTARTQQRGRCRERLARRLTVPANCH
jgi:hypothetical protein